jgi:hypothetical protein
VVFKNKLGESVAGIIIGGLIGTIGAAAGIGAMLWGMGVGEYLGGKKRAAAISASKEELEQKLLALNSQDVPYLISPARETDLMLEWKIADAAWWGFFSKQGVRETYRAYLLLDAGKHTVRYYEELARVDWTVDIDGLSHPHVAYQNQFFKGRILFQKSWEAQYTPGSAVPVYEIDFDVRNLRAPVKQAVEQAGWEFVPVVRKNHATCIAV